MAKGIMIQGTMSGAGKSFLVAGLLRVFKEDGYKAAPFKSQNMALNSFITREGLEIGRAQAMQAEAAGIEPSVYMNPVLLKPTSDVGSQVIVNGEVLGNMRAKDYFAFKKTLVPDILRAYRKLSEEYDIIVIEGAGSPAEINLKQNDIVNMGLAEMLNVPVLLAGDIDRGGVFAQLYGTVALLEPREQERIKGLLINKFRGDKSILDPGIEMIQKLTRKKVVGTIPYMKVDLEEEDSLSERLEKKQGFEKGPEGQGRIKIAAVRFPRLSNYTDLAPLEHLEGVEVIYARTPGELERADLIILPGSKNTMGDLKWFRESGMEAEALRKYSQGTRILGICGGFQMMGQWIEDPKGVEEGGRMHGMGLLSMETEFSSSKERTRINGVFPYLGEAYQTFAGASYEGYEIHMGHSRQTKGPDQEKAFCWETNGRLIGMSCGRALGTYIHGVLDREEAAGALLRILAEEKGVNPALGVQDYRQYKEEQYRVLSENLRRHLDMNLIYEILNQGGHA